jgi:cytochrome c oxidase subunit II
MERATIRSGERRTKLFLALGLLALGLLLTGCAPDATQDTLKPVGDVAKEEKNLFVPVFWVAVAVFVIVQGGILLILFRYRHRKGRDRLPPQTHGNTRLEVGWTIAPAVVLAVVMVPTVSLIWDLARGPDAGALNITVAGHQWWWGFEYTDDDMTVSYDPQTHVQTADVMVIPTDRQVYLSLESEGGGAKDANGVTDFQVIHSFWVPQLFGKQDVVPGRTNHIVFQVDEPGTYTGQCAEFCGLQHGRMRLRVVALPPAEFGTWAENQKLAPGGVTDELAKQGEQIIMNPLSGGRGACLACHTVGAPAGLAAPNLTHFATPTHECFAGCDFDVFKADGSPNVEALKAWLRDPDAVKLGAKMPNYHLSDEEIDALVAYLYSLT